ncbi:MAG: tRNA preQ1(34) S-adenosylmethionine ribosyltransferase-isomerase QueA [Leptospirillia bacterium]
MSHAARPVTNPAPGGALTADYDFKLPPELIAARPPERRDASRLMRLRRHSGEISHHGFGDLSGLLQPGDLLILNDTRVFPARIRGVKPRTGGGVELLLLTPLDDDPACWKVMAKGRLRPGEAVELTGGLRGELETDLGDGFWRCRFDSAHGANVIAHLEKHGEMPLPPYIDRPADSADKVRYQTVFAKETGSVAAPTSGLHFTDETFAALKKRGVETTTLTLHVGPGTFLPVRAEHLDDHVMHAESYRIDEAAAAAIGLARERGGRVVACGTTVTRALESVADEGGHIAVASGDTRLFIRPGYRFRAVDAMLTNLHLPGSTLLMLVSAFAGRERILAAYAEAVAERYRFFSYGDAMLID